MQGGKFVIFIIISALFYFCESSKLFSDVAKIYLQPWLYFIISSRNENKLIKAVESLKNLTKKNEIYYKPCNVSNYAEVNNTISFIENEISNINIALLNATAYSPNRNQEFDINNYNLLIDVNLNGTINCIDVLKNYMKGRNNLISIVSSPVGYRGMPTAGAYGMTKAAQLNLVESLYFDFKKLNIKISVINPGFIDTESTKLNSFKIIYGFTTINPIL